MKDKSMLSMITRSVDRTRQWASDQARQLIAPSMQTSGISTYHANEILSASIRAKDALGVAHALKSGAEVDRLDEDGWSCLHNAVLSASPEVCELLIQAGADLNSTTANGMTPLMKAIDLRHGDLAIMLIKAGADVHAVNDNRSSAMHMASLQGNLAVCKLLHELGASVNQANKVGSTPLHMAASGQEEAGLWLLENGAKTDALTHSQNTPLHRACANGLFQLACAILKTPEGAKTLDAPCNAGYTPLLLASESNHCDVIQLLLDHGSSIESLTELKRTALHLGAMNGHGDACALLIKAGVPVYQIDVSGRTAKGLAKENGHAHIPPLIDACLNSMEASRAIDKALGRSGPESTHSRTAP